MAREKLSGDALFGLFMAHQVIVQGLEYTVYAVELGLLVLLLRHSRWRERIGVSAYVGFFFAVDAVARRLTSHFYGRLSHQYAYLYWLTDVLLALGAFLLICTFFRRACAREEEKIWRFLRVVLVFVFMLVLGISFLSLLSHYGQLFTSFIIEFGQNLYFTCLVLNTLLYILMQQIETQDEELGLLVCGMGIQFAGPAASLALFHLTAGQSYARSLTVFIMPLCTLGMLLTWCYAVTRTPKVAEASARDARKQKLLAPVQAVASKV